jgi:hypothetical protein
MHEHVFILQPEALQDYGHVFGPSYGDEEEFLKCAVERFGLVGHVQSSAATASASTTSTRWPTGSTRSSRCSTRATRRRSTSATTRRLLLENPRRFFGAA